jgi:predicted O-methyltransferase YrrM
MLLREVKHGLDLRLPARPLEKLPSFDIPRGITNGRCVYEGYQRGWGLEFGDLNRQVARDPLFRAAYAAAKRNPKTRTVVTDSRLANIFLILKFGFKHLPSHNIVEFGSYRGGSAIFMAVVLAELYPDARVYALDTFGGMPDTDPSKDLHKAGDFSDTNMETIGQAVDGLGLRNLELVRGLVEDTGPGVYERAGSFGLSHLDLDIYSGLKFAQDSVWPYMTPGGYVVYDDATVSSCIGATQAVEELIVERKMSSEQIYPHFVFRTHL